MSGSTPPRIVVLASGEGTNLQALIDAESEGGADAPRVAAVFSDRAEARALDRARAAGIAAHFIGRAEFASRAAYEDALARAIEAERPDAVVLAGFMRVLGPAFVRRFAGRMINLHPSLLPKYPGLDTHARVLAAGDELHGATVHFVTDELDAGPPILQYRMRVRRGEPIESLIARVHAGEHVILPRAAGWLATGRVELREGSAWLDGRRLSAPIVVEEE
ncbi:MAG TPA: phosphoribosylglycinamide formyltransferase [Gammaproteobacteria bacterium]|nr:phosphoribosylglycinamide formyltransferase [Gammaproteobacteria bacterium]